MTDLAIIGYHWKIHHQLRQHRTDLVDVEPGHLPGWLATVGKGKAEILCLPIVSDLPGSGSTLERLSEGEAELIPAFQVGLDRILQEHDLVAPSDHRLAPVGPCP